MTFASTAKVQQDFVNADAAHQQQALASVAALTAEGGTNLAAALELAFTTLRVARTPRFVVLLTDGAPTVGVTASVSIWDQVARANLSGARVFVFGIGNDVRVELLDLLAERSGGERAYVAAGEDLAPVVERFFRRLAEPRLTQLDVRAEGVTLTQVTPQTLPDVFRGSQVLITGRWSGGPRAQLKVSAESATGPVSFSKAVDFSAGGDLTAFVPRLHATRRIGVLLDLMRLQGETPEILREARDLSQRYGVLTPWTGAWLVPQSKAPSPSRWVGSAAATSEQLQRMRTLVAPGDDDGAAGSVALLGGRTLLRRDAGWTELALVLAASDPWAARLERVEEGSERWEALLQEQPALSAVFALGPPLLLEHAGRVIQLVPTCSLIQRGFEVDAKSQGLHGRFEPLGRQGRVPALGFVSVLVVSSRRSLRAEPPPPCLSCSKKASVNRKSAESWTQRRLWALPKYP